MTIILEKNYKAYAKLNLFLDILNKDLINYHNILTYFQFIDLYDVINFKWYQSDAIRNSKQLDTINKQDFDSYKEQFLQNLELIGMDHIVTKKDNIIFKAISAVLNSPKINLENINIELLNSILKISVTKNIPDQAGLGGGSSDASTTMLAINESLNLGLTITDLLDIALSIGADCPIFITKQSQVAWGYGQKYLSLEQNQNFINSLAQNIIAKLDAFIEDFTYYLTFKDQINSYDTLSSKISQSPCGLSFKLQMLVLNSHLENLNKQIINTINHKITTVNQKITEILDNHPNSIISCCLHYLEKNPFTYLLETKNPTNQLTEDPASFLLIIPKDKISTAEAFNGLKNLPDVYDPNYAYSIVKQFITDGSLDNKYISYWGNDFQVTALHKFPWLLELFEICNNNIQLTGSGSVLFVPIFNENDVDNILTNLEPLINNNQIKIIKSSALTTI